MVAVAILSVVSVVASIAVLVEPSLPLSTGSMPMQLKGLAVVLAWVMRGVEPCLHQQGLAIMSIVGCLNCIGDKNDLLLCLPARRAELGVGSIVR
jgi:hypothetical protein